MAQASGEKKNITMAVSVQKEEILRTIQEEFFPGGSGIVGDLSEMGIDLGCGDVCVPQQLLYCS